jgi:hypothetical protein
VIRKSRSLREPRLGQKRMSIKRLKHSLNTHLYWLKIMTIKSSLMESKILVHPKFTKTFNPEVKKNSRSILRNHLSRTASNPMNTLTINQSSSKLQETPPKRHSVAGKDSLETHLVKTCQVSMVTLWILSTIHLFRIRDKVHRSRLIIRRAWMHLKNSTMPSRAKIKITSSWEEISKCYLFSIHKADHLSSKDNQSPKANNK